MEKVPFLGQTLMRWRVGQSTFLALPEKGARLMSWNVTLGDGSLRDVLYWPESKTLDDFHKVRGGNPILFPFSARSFDQGDIHFWRDPAGTRRPMPMHGFARQGEFQVTRMDARGFSAQLVPGDEARDAYPFKYEFTVVYRFSSLGLACELVLKNLDTQPIPWSAGHHFYFTVPWSDDQTRADYGIRIPATKRLRQDAQGRLVPGPTTLKLDEKLTEPALIDTFHLGLKTNAVAFGPLDAMGQVTVHNGISKIPAPEATFVTWSLEEASPFYCVEPWMGPANAAETKVGLHWVQPGQSQSFIVDVLVK